VGGGGSGGRGLGEGLQDMPVFLSTQCKVNLACAHRCNLLYQFIRVLNVDNIFHKLCPTQVNLSLTELYYFFLRWMKYLLTIHL
jgi:hypothetical protein